MANVGYATLQVIPSLKGLDRSMSGQLSGPLGRAGIDAGDRASKGFRGKFSTGLKAAGIAAGGALASGLTGALAVIGVGAKEASDASAGIAQLQSGIKSTGNVANVSVKGMENLASSIEGFSGQTDDSIVASEQLLLTFTNIRNAAGKGNDIFNQATLATANLAAKMGGDASTSAIQLGKALNDPVKGITALTRVGVSFTQGQKDQIKALVAAGDTMGAQKIILKELNTEFGGAAKAAGQSIPGQLARAKRSFEGLSQGIVQTLIPIALPAVSALSSGLKKLAPIAASAAQSIVGGLSSLAKRAASALQGVDFSGLIAGAKDALAQILPPLQRLGSALADLFVNHLVPLFVNFGKAVLPSLVSAGKSLATIFVGSILPAFKELADFASAHVIPIVAKVADVLSAFLGFLAKHQGAVKVFAKVALGLLVARFAALKVKAAVQGVRSFVDSVKGGIASVKNFATKSADIAKSVGRAGSAVLSFGKNMLISAANVARQTAAFVAQKVAMAAAAVAQKAMAAAQWLLNAAMDANPVVLIVAGIAALVAGVVLAYQHFKPFRDIVDAVGRAIRTAAGWIKGAAVAAFNWIKDHWPLILAILTGPIGLAVLAIKSNWTKITNAFNAVKDGIGIAVSAVVRFITGIPSRIASTVSGMWDGIKNGFKTVYNFLKDKIETVVGWVVSLPKRISDAASGMWDGIKNAFKSAINWIIDGWNSLEFTLPKINTHIPGVGKIGGWTLGTPDIPELATGAVATKRMLAFIGEKSSPSRPEIVTPQALLRSTIDDALRRNARPIVGGDTYITIEAHGLEDFHRKVIDVVRTETRRNGYVRGVRVAG